MQRFCMRNGIKYDEFVTWYKKTQNAIEPVVVVGEPEEPSSPIARTDSPTSSGVELTYSAGLLPTGRKNSLMFGSHKGAEMSAIFHTFIETCKINGISTIEYFKKLLSELLTGNNNYASLLPQTIGIKR